VTRRLFVYYRVASADLQAVVEAVRQCQAVLMQAGPELHCALLRRPEAHDDQVTLMEVYTASQGIDNGQQTRIEAVIEQLRLPLTSPRHAEVFEDLG
jgi:hypothetical protein